MDMEKTDRRQRGVGSVFLFGIILGLAALCARLAYINSVMRPHLAQVGARQSQGYGVLPARRGMIFDRRGRVVALSRRSPDVFVDPARVTDLPRLIERLAPRLNMSGDELMSKIERRRDSRFVVLASRVDPVTAAAVAELEDKGVGISEGIQRVYPLGDSLAHLLGWVGRDGHGMEGIELAFDEHLRGTDGKRRLIHDAARRALRRLPSPHRDSTVPRDGGQVVLTIDAEIQRIAEQALAKAVTRYEGQSGVAIVMSPINGDILAMANFPAFDANAPFDDATQSPRQAGYTGRRNRAVTDPIEPGSTFKPMIICGALAGDFVTTDEKIDCHMGSYRFGNRRITDTHPHGLMDIRGIVSRSSNIGMGVIAHRMGNQGLHDIVRRFGFGEKTGIEVPGESGGLVRPLSKWNSYSINSVAIGYEILVTPLQLVSAIAAIVNDGILLKPRIVKEVLGPGGKVLQSFDGPEVVRRVVSSEIARYVSRDLMVAVMDVGSGRRIHAGPYRMMGKTGTPKLTYTDRPLYEDGAYLGLFVGAAPVDNPQIVVLAMVRRPNPSLGYYGGVVAGPAVGEIIHATLKYLGVPPANVSARNHL